MTLDKAYLDMFGDGKPTITNLTCPITGQVLWSIPADNHVMDASQFYYPEGHRGVIFERHPFSWRIFRQTNTKSFGGKVISWWKLEDNNSWTQYIEIPGTSEIVPISTSKKEIKAIKDKIAKEKREREKAYDERIASGWVDPFKAIQIARVNMNTISNDLIPVVPMAAPSGSSFYVEFKYRDDVEKEPTYPYLITEENLVENTKIWNSKEHNWGREPVEFKYLKVGDTIDVWDNGGGLSLALRRYELVIRDGVEIYRRLIAMS